MKQMIYLDNAATTSVDINVAELVNKVSIETYGNPSSKHSKGMKSKKLLEESREKIAKFINALPEEIYFTSGGTESNNLALKGLAIANPGKKHIITSQIEHPAIIETCKTLEKQGYNVDYISVDSDGIINLKELESKIKQDTLVVSVMHVNNEIGTIQPIEKIAGICQTKKVYFHSDCVQSFAKIPIDVKKVGLDLISVSGHKINAPRGIGFLYVKKEVEICPIIDGGGQENNLRSGTENLPGIIGLAEALDIKRNKEEIKRSRDRIIKELEKIPSARINGSKEKRIYNNINVSFYGVEGESLMMLLDKEKICVSTGSACSSHKLAQSHVLKAINLDHMYINGSIRITLDKVTFAEEKYIIDKIQDSVSKLQEISPFKFQKNK